jgi:hypothetical protein
VEVKEMKHIIYPIFILFTFFASAFAQVGGSSVMIYNRATPGTEESSVGSAAEQAIIKGLEDKFPCVDWMNEQILKDALQKLREKELLTGELDQQALAELGKSVGASYIIVVRVYTMGNGQIVVSVRVLDGKSASTVADRIETAQSGEAAYNAAQKAAQQILQDLSSKFRNECEAHWTGTIIYTIKTLKNKTETREMTKINKYVVTNSEDYDQTTTVTLQPMARGGKTNFFNNGNTSMIMSRVFRKYFNHTEQNVTETGEEACRQRGANPYKKQFTSVDKKIIDEQGQNSETLPVEITVYSDTGRFVIKVPTPEVKIKKTQENSGVRDFCEPQPFSEIKPSERTEISSFFDFEGQVDPKNPNILAGTKSTGTLETRQYTFIWNLRLVKPKDKKTKSKN